MLATKEVLAFEAEQVARKARTILAMEGFVAPVALFYRESMSDVAVIPVELGDDEEIWRVKRFLSDAVKHGSPEAVVVVYQAIGVTADDDGEAEAIAMMDEHPKKKMILNIEAASPAAEHGLMVIYGVKDKKLRFEEECTIDESDRCRFTNGLWGRVN